MIPARAFIATMLLGLTAGSVQALPDLQIYRLDIPGGGTVQGRFVYVRATIVTRNIGSEAAGESRVTASARIQGESRFQSLPIQAAHGTQSLSNGIAVPEIESTKLAVAQGFIKFPRSWSGKTVEVVARADSCIGFRIHHQNCRVWESSEFNNLSQIEVISLN